MTNDSHVDKLNSWEEVVLKALDMNARPSVVFYEKSIEYPSGKFHLSKESLNQIVDYYCPGK